MIDKPDVFEAMASEAAKAKDAPALQKLALKEAGPLRGRSGKQKFAGRGGRRSKNTVVPCIKINVPHDLNSFVCSVSQVDRDRSTKGKFQPIVKFDEVASSQSHPS